MALEGLGRLPAEKKLVVNSEPGPTSYTQGTGLKVRMDLNTLTSIYDIISVWQYPEPLYTLSVSGWADNIITVLLGQNPMAAGKHEEVSAGTDVSDVSVFVAAMGK